MAGKSLAGKAIVDQLNELHNISVSAPSELLYRTFDGGYVGRGWNMWGPGADVPTLLSNARQPIGGRRVFCCGQATAEIQGWVMDTISSTESVMAANFNLARPDWWPKTYPIT
jgi:hypothetical protein